MKVKIENWGPIKCCEYDLDKDVIVTYGDNNIGKSYAMQLIYLYLRELIQYSNTVIQYRSLFSVRDNSMIEKFVMDFASNDNLKELDITDKIIECMALRLKADVIRELDNSLRNTFGTYDDIIENDPIVTFNISNDISCKFCIKDKSADLKYEIKPIYLKNSNSDFHKSRDGKKRFDIYIFNKNQISNAINLVEEQIDKLMFRLAFEILGRVKAVYFLPASRSGIYTGMNSFGPILAELSKNRAYIRGTLQIPSISEPISDYYMKLSTIRMDKARYCIDIAEEIEREILKGKVSFDAKKKAIMYQGDNTSQIMEMKDVSSMVSEISPIIAYLKYIIGEENHNPILRRKVFSGFFAKSATIIFIEEPEAHLHPKNQVKLMKIFSKLNNKNIKLFMASHSNYIFNELNNRVLAGDLSKNNYEPVLMEYKDGKSYTLDMHIDEFGVDDNNFQDVTASIIEEREALINALIQRMNKKVEE